MDWRDEVDSSKPGEGVPWQIQGEVEMVLNHTISERQMKELTFLFRHAHGFLTKEDS